MTFDNEGIRVEAIKTSYLCGQPGRELCGGLHDRLFGAPRVWGLLHCRVCSLIWLDPQPIREDIGKFYAKYYTQGASGRTVPTPHAATEKIPWRQKAKHSILAEHFGYPHPYPTQFLKAAGKIGGRIPLLRGVAGGFVREFAWVGGGTLLEVGCCDGEFLATMRHRGWRVRGVEPDPADGRPSIPGSSWHLKRRGGFWAARQATHSS